MGGIGASETFVKSYALLKEFLSRVVCFCALTKSFLEHFGEFLQTFPRFAILKA